MEYEIENESLKLLTNSLKGCRKDKREKVIEELSLKFLELSKSKGLIGFAREHINEMVKPCEYKRSQEDNAVNEILGFMTSKNLIKEYTQLKPIQIFRNKPLSSFDYGSYALLMKKNGYKTKLFKYENNDFTITDEEGHVNTIRQFPKKKLIKAIAINERIPEDLESYDEIEQISTKPLSQQGVITNSKNSVVRETYKYYEKKLYSIV